MPGSPDTCISGIDDRLDRTDDRFEEGNLLILTLELRFRLNEPEPGTASRSVAFETDGVTDRPKSGGTD